MKLLHKVFKKKPQLKINVFLTSSAGSTKTKKMVVPEVRGLRNVYQLHLDNYYVVSVEVEK
jgi:hypothetical protein